MSTPAEGAIMRRLDDGSGCGARAPVSQTGSRAAAGLHSRAIRPGARSWLTGVAGPRTESVARAPSDSAVARREAPACFERNMRLTERVSRLIGAPRPRLHAELRGKAGSPGAVQTTRAITRASSSFRGAPKARARNPDAAAEEEKRRPCRSLRLRRMDSGPTR